MPLEIAEEELIYPRCNKEMKPLGKEIVRDELRYIPTKLKVIRYVRYFYWISIDKLEKIIDVCSSLAENKSVVLDCAKKP